VDWGVGGGEFVGDGVAFVCKGVIERTYHSKRTYSSKRTNSRHLVLELIRFSLGFRV